MLIIYSICRVDSFHSDWKLIGAPEKSRTPNLQIRNLALYPIELRALLSFSYFYYLVELLNIFEYHMSTANINCILSHCLKHLNKIFLY